jgi:hypothetical protein
MCAISQRCTKPTMVGKSHAHFVTQHDYHDHAPDPILVFASSSPPSPSKEKGHQVLGINCSINSSFPVKLYEMIQKIETDGLAHVVSWQPHGRCFLIHEATTFKHLMQNYFKLSKIASFQRQLNLYDFQRLTVGVDKGSYYHELFLQNRPDLASQIQRIKVKGTGVRAKSNPEDEPNLYLYPAVDGFGVATVTKVQSLSLAAKTNARMVVCSQDGVKPNCISTLNHFGDVNTLIHGRCDDDMIMEDPVKPNGVLRNVSSSVLDRNRSTTYTVSNGWWGSKWIRKYNRP